MPEPRLRYGRIGSPAGVVLEDEDGGDALTAIRGGAIGSLFDLGARLFNVEAYRQPGDSDAVATGRAMDALIENQGGILGFAQNREYTFASGLRKQFPQFRSTIDAHGAKITATFDGVLFDVNPARVDNGWDGTDADTLRKFRVIGGEWYNTAATRTSSIAVKAWGMRDFVAECTYMEGWGKAYEICGKDTYRFLVCYFRGCVYNIYHPTDAVSGITSSGDLPLMIEIQGGQHSGASGTSVTGVYLGTKCINFQAIGVSWVGDYSGPQVYCSDSTLQFGESYSFLFCHWEKVTAQGGLVFDDAGGTGFKCVSIRGGTVISSVTGWKWLILKRVLGCTVDDVEIRDGSGGGSEIAIDLDANCKDFVRRRSTQFTGVATPITYACARAEITWEPADRPAAVVITGYNTSGLSTTAAATIDMSTAISSKWPAGPPPLGYTISILAWDSGSAAAAANAVYVRIRKGGASAANNDLRVSLSGAPNGEKRMATRYVEADENGDIDIDFGASGAGTLSISVYVDRIHM